MAQLIKYNNKGFLREHCFIDPVTQAVPVQKHSYIYPGDEIVLYHDIVLPTNAGAAGMTNLRFVDAKVSLIVQKPNIFDEIFRKEFQATRGFELDSFQIVFNTTNALLIPWGTDGYAPKLQVQQDRNWKLPSGNYRRQINFSTLHTPGTTLWTYRFAFPVLFRWEYWLPLASVDLEFYDPALPQNGLNQFWERFCKYLFSDRWIVKSRLELNLLVANVQTQIRNDLILTTGDGTAGQIDILDYNTNTDWTNKAIKTSVITGVPSNTPCLIKGNEDTEVFGYFDKVSPWALGGGEQSNISALIWIEPFEGSGITSRTRASSLYQITPETVFSGLNFSLTDDSGIGIQNAAGEYIVIDNAGNGVLMLFDGINPEKLRVFALIDHNKLNTVYPGVTKFKLYIRLYNSTIVAGETKQGEEITQQAILISLPDTNPLCTANEPICPFNMNVYANSTDNKELENDKTAFYECGDPLISNIRFVLQKNTIGCGEDGWKDVVTFNSAVNYGKWFAFGKHPNFSGAAFIDEYEKQYTGLFLEWRKILLDSDLGKGMYRMKIIKSDVFDVDTTYYDQRIFCLHEYHCNLVNSTVRIDTFNKGTRGSLSNPQSYTDYSTGWNDQIRLPGVLKYKKSTYVEEFSEFGDNDYNRQENYISEQKPQYILSIRPIPWWMDYYLSTNVLQANLIYVTDYNSRNRHPFKRLLVKNNGEFEPRDSNLANPLADVNLYLISAQNNLRMRNS